MSWQSEFTKRTYANWPKGNDGPNDPHEYFCNGGAVRGGHYVTIRRTQPEQVFPNGGIRIELETWNHHYERFLSLLQIELPDFTADVPPEILADYLEELPDGERHTLLISALRDAIYA
jgi:hypothetical protein